MGQRVYILSKSNKWNVLGIYTNIRQVRQSIKRLAEDPAYELEEIILQEIRMNEVAANNCGRIVTFMLKESPSNEKTMQTPEEPCEPEASFL